MAPGPPTVSRRVTEWQGRTNEGPQSTGGIFLRDLGLTRRLHAPVSAHFQRNPALYSILFSV